MKFDGGNVVLAGRLRHELVVSWVYLVIMASSALPTPIYPLYRQRLGLSPVGITAVYGFYAIVVLVTLLRLGFLSDRIGRRPVVSLAIAITVISNVVLMASPTPAGLYLGRGLMAVAVGLAIAALPAYLTDLAGPAHTARATTFGVVANMGGQALGTLIAGRMAGFGSAPLATPYLAGLVLLVPAVLLWTMRVPETVSASRRDGLERHRENRIPHYLRPSYRATAVTIVAAFAMFGSMTAMTGQILQQRMLVAGTSTAGLVTAAMFVSGAAGQMLAGRSTAVRNSAATVVPLPLAAILFCLATLLASLPIFIAAVVVCGFGGGSCLRSGGIRVLAQSPVENRAHVSSRLFAALYLGACVPTISVGVLATTAGLNVSMLSLGLLVVSLSAVAALLLSRLTGTDEALATTVVLALPDVWATEPTVQFFALPAAPTVRIFKPDVIEFPPSRGRLMGVNEPV